MLDNDYGVHGGGGDIEAGFGCSAPVGEDKLFVAVGKEVRESESLLLWAIQNSGGRIISVVHVHQPDGFIPILGKKYHWTSLEEQQVKNYRGIERQLMLRTLDEYLQICRHFGVQAEKLYIEMDNVEKGLMQFIARYNIEKLVMGAASDDSYHMKMTEPKSKTALYLQQHAPVSCHIWFICKGHLILEREASSRGRVCAENEQSTNLQSLSIPSQCNKSEVSHQEPLLGEGTSHSVVNDGRDTKFPYVHNAEIVPVSQTQLDLEANCHDWGEALGLSRSQRSDFSTGSSSHVSRDSTADPFELFAGPCEHPQPPSISQARSSESLYVERKWQQIEELQLVKSDRDRLREDLESVMDQNLLLESKIANYDQVMKDLEEGMLSNVELLQICEKERDDLKNERDNVLKTAEELLNQSAEAASRMEVSKFFATLTFAEIEEVTSEFDPSLQLWEGESGSLYKGILSHCQVTVRMWHPEGLQGPRGFHQEVEILSKYRHPNLITLMAICPEAWALVYEHLPNGNLEERLHCKDNTPPLSWQTRIRIATEICSALIFLHFREPLRVVHGALQPSCILLDSNFTCKISDFGFSYVISHEENSVSIGSSYSSPTTAYTDPYILDMGEVSPAADVYSFGVVVLELLTGKPASEPADELQDALDEYTLDSFLDASAGEWPYVQAKQLAQLALRCCEENPTNRPDLESIWRVLEPMRASCAGSPSYHIGDEEHRQAPSYFICPIFQEVMKDPHVAADGYTYEAEALRGWLETGHNTSPMTNLQLEHSNLVPNHALRSAIQEWRQQR